MFALLIVKEATGSELLGAIAFSIGFIALTLGNLVGGVVLVTGLRLVQVGMGRIGDERAVTEEEAAAEES